MLDIVARDVRWEVVGLLDPDPGLRGTEVLGVPVLGDDDLLPELMSNGVSHAFVGLGSAGDGTPRRRLYELALSHGLRLVDAIHPSAVVSPSAFLGPAVTIMAEAVVNAAARLGANVIVNTGAVVEHDCLLGDHVHVATAAALGGDVEVGEGAHVGLGASVREGVRIGAGAVVAAGAVVVADVPEGAVVAGVPARPLERSAR